MRRYLFPVSWLTQQRLAEIATIVDENIQGVRVVKAFAAEPHELAQAHGDDPKGAVGDSTRDADIRARWVPLIENLPRLGQAVLLLYGGYLAINGQATIGDIVAFNAYVLMLQPPFRQLGGVLMLGQRAAASAQRIFQVLDERPTVVDRPDAIDLTDCRGDVRFEGVSFRYANGPLVVNDLTLHLRPGETVALVGRTGSGKSTIARLLARFYDVTDGAVRIDGHDVRDVTLPSLRHQIGMALDEPFLFSVSIRDNIAYGRPDATLDEVVAAATAAGADDFIRELPDGYDTVVGERGFTLSGGQRQRIAIARVLVLNPPILVLDDATSAIDVQTEQQIHAALDAADAGPDDADRRPPARDDQPGRPGRGHRGRPRDRRGHARRAAGHRPPLRRDPRAHRGGRPAARRGARGAPHRARARRRAPPERRRSRPTSPAPASSSSEKTTTSSTRPTSRPRHAAAGSRLMAWGGGGIGLGAGMGGQASGPGLPFGGIPHEMQQRVEQLLSEEPAWPAAKPAFSHRSARSGVNLRRAAAPAPAARHRRRSPSSWSRRSRSRRGRC